MKLGFSVPGAMQRAGRRAPYTPVPLVAVSCALLVACASAPPVERERRIAASMDKQVRSEVKVFEDPVVNSYIDKLGEELLRVIGPHAFDYAFTVIDNDALNAFVTPGGGIFIHTGAILQMRNVSELAGLLAHVIGHVVKRHAAHNWKRAREAGLFRNIALFGVAIGTGNSDLVKIASDISGMAAVGHINQFDHEAESEADDFAMEVLPRAGYHPDGVADLFESLQGQSASRRSTFLDSHPAPVERILAVRAQIDQALLPSDLRMDDNGRLEIIQHRIRCLTGKLSRGPCAGVRRVP